MPLTTLKTELERKAAEEAEKVEAGAREEAKALKSAAREEAKRISGQLLSQAESELEAEELRVSAARLQARKIVQEARYAIAEQAVTEAGKLLKEKARDRKDYEKLLAGLVKQAIEELGSKDFVLRVSARDKTSAAKFGPVGAPIETAGGVIAETRDGRVRVNNTFEALLEEKSAVLKQKAHELLF